MIYTITIERSDGLTQSLKFDGDVFDLGDGLQAVAHVTHRMADELAKMIRIVEQRSYQSAYTWLEDMEAKKLFQDEYFKSIQPERRSTLQYGEQILPLNPHEPSPFMKKLREMERHRLNEQIKNWETDHTQDMFPQQTLNTFVKDDSNDQSES